MIEDEINEIIDKTDNNDNLENDKNIEKNQINQMNDNIEDNDLDQMYFNTIFYIVKNLVKIDSIQTQNLKKAESSINTQYLNTLTEKELEDNAKDEKKDHKINLERKISNFNGIFSSSMPLEKVVDPEDWRRNEILNYLRNASNEVIQFKETEFFTLKKQRIKPYLGSLVHLIKSDFFDIHLLINYLNKYSNNTIYDFLINEIHDRHINKSYFYLPQLCSMLVYKDSLTLEQFLIEHCTDRMRFAVKIYWLLHSFKKGSINLENKAVKMEIAMVNNKVKAKKNITSGIMSNINFKYINGNSNSNNESKIDYNSSEHFELITQKSLAKEIRLNYFIKLCEFYEDIAKICELLFKTELSKRQEILEDKIEYLNNKIKKLKNIKTSENLTKDLNIYLHSGYLLPFEDNETNNDEESNLIVNILPKVSRCFKSKARVPILLTFELIKVYEVKFWNELITENVEESFISTSKTDNGSSEYQYNKKKTETIEYESLEDFLLKSSEINNEVNNDSDNIINETNNEINSNKEENSKIDKVDNKSDHKKEIVEISKYTYTKNVYGLVDWKSVSAENNPFGKPWILQQEEIKAKSKFRNFKSYNIKSFIYKTNDDLKQELMIIQLIKRCQEIFSNANLRLKLQLYEIIITSEKSGMVEVLNDTCSIHEIKKSFVNTNLSLKEFYLKVFGMNFEEAKIHFAESLAAYSIICYIFQIKDRHNGNILIDNCGHIIHIDFGFVLGISPGNMNFENVPFKLTLEYIELLGGEKSEVYEYFVLLMMKGLNELKKHIDNLVSIIEILKNGCEMPCFSSEYFNERINELKLRISNKNEDPLVYTRNLVYESSNSWRTNKYDSFQKMTNDIYY